MKFEIGKVLVAAVAAGMMTGLEARVTTSKPEEVAKRIPQETAAARAQRMAWWTEGRFGMMIPFGLFALPASHESIKSNGKMSDAQYRRYFDHFNPDRLDAKAWAKAAKAAGMKYVILTTKHNEGFCLFDAHNTDYKVTNTPCGRDIVREFVDAFRAEGLRIGLYYSLIDWHHPDFTWDCYHPRFAKDAKGEPTAEVRAHNAKCDFANYLKYMREHLTQLLTEYGKIDILWFDFAYPWKNGKGRDDWDSAALLSLVRKLQPGILVNGRLDLDDVPGGFDFVTPEQFKVSEWPTRNGVKVPWETCQKFFGCWSYNRDRTKGMDERQVLRLLIDTVANGGNLLVGVGPTARGRLDRANRERLDWYAKWMDDNSRAIYGCTAAPAEFTAPQGTALTYNPKTRRLYVHLCEYPLDSLPFTFADRVDYAQFLHDGSEVTIGTLTAKKEWDTSRAPNHFFNLPTLKPDTEIPVIEIFLK